MTDNVPPQKALAVLISNGTGYDCHFLLLISFFMFIYCKPGNRDGCRRRGIRHKNTSGCMSGLYSHSRLCGCCRPADDHTVTGMSERGPVIKSSPIDVLPSVLLRSFATSFAPIISHMANLSFAECSFPTAFKTAQVLHVPLLKKPGLDNEQMSSYRPISNLTTISKVIERLVL